MLCFYEVFWFCLFSCFSFSFPSAMSIKITGTTNIFSPPDWGMLRRSRRVLIFL